MTHELIHRRLSLSMGVWVRRGSNLVSARYDVRNDSALLTGTWGCICRVLTAQLYIVQRMLG